MKHLYEEYEASRLWEFVKSSIEDLVENNDIQLFTPIEYIVGHICKNISSTDINSGEKSPKQSISSYQKCLNGRVCKTVPSYNNYSPILFILHSPYFLIQNIVLSILFFSFIAKRVYKNNEVCINHLMEKLSPLKGCTSIRMLQSSTWKVPLNLSYLFYFSLYDCINKQVPSAFNVSVVSTSGGNTPQYVPATETKLTLFPKTAVYSSSLIESIPESFCPVLHKASHRNNTFIPRAMPWARSFWAFSPFQPYSQKAFNLYRSKQFIISRAVRIGKPR